MCLNSKICSNLVLLKDKKVIVMKRIVLVLVMLCVSLTFAQDKKEKVKYVKSGKLIEATYYYNNGNISQQGFFRNNKRHGKWIQYNLHGEKVVVGYYKKGKKTGKWIFKTGNTLEELDYLNNKIVKANHWTSKSSMAIRD